VDPPRKEARRIGRGGPQSDSQRALAERPRLTAVLAWLIVARLDFRRAPCRIAPGGRRFSHLIQCRFAQLHGATGPGSEVIAMANKVKCRPVRGGKKPGPKTVPVRQHERSKPKPLPKKC